MRRTLGASLGFLVCCVPLGALAGCGGGERQDAGDRAATYEVRIVSASFPSDQSISSPAPLRIVVRNEGRERIPDVAVSLAGLSVRDSQRQLADPEEAIWIIEDQPAAGETAYDFTWALGPLGPGEQRTFGWRLTPAVAGTHDVTWTVAAGLTGKASARTSGGRAATGTFKVRVSTDPGEATVDPDTGAVVPER